MSNLGIFLGVLLVFAPRNAVSNMMTFYSEENAFMKLVENTKHGFTYWNQKCSDLGDGWRLAVISSQTKYELIEQKHGALSDDSSCWVGGSTDTEDEKFVPFFRYVSNSTGQRHVLISTHNCGVYGTSNFQLISNVGSTLLHGALCETHGLSYKSDTSLYQKLVSSTSHNFSYWERKCSEIGDGWAPAVINSQTEHDFIKTEQRTLSNNNNCWIGGSTNSIPGTNFDYGHRYDPQPDSPVRVFVSTHVVSGRNSNGVFQLRAESSSFLLPGVLCEKQVGGNDGGGNDTGSNNGGGNNLP